MWRNGCINDTYEPGSTFKIITAAAGLEEGVVTPQSTFSCPGYIIVDDRKIKCHKVAGHGGETFVQGTMNSCNPVFITVGLRLGIDKYYEYATESIKEMYRQVGNPEIDENGLIKKGLIVRHLILPNNMENSKKVLKWIKDEFDTKILVSVMAQYFPTNKAMEFEEINRKLTQEEYDEIEDFVFELNLDGYMQDLEENEEQYVPNFE